MNREVLICGSACLFSAWNFVFGLYLSPEVPTASASCYAYRSRPFGSTVNPTVSRLPSFPSGAIKISRWVQTSHPPLLVSPALPPLLVSGAERLSDLNSNFMLKVPPKHGKG